MCLRHRDLDWAKFVKGEVTTQEKYLQALESCDTCLREYTQQLETVLEAPSPNFTDSVMAKIAAENARAAKGKIISRFTPFLHYAAAACLTLWLFEVGAFDWLCKLSSLELDLSGQLLKHLGELISALKINLGG